MLQAKNLKKKIEEKELIANITLNFQPGVLYGILGPNGSGKSTFLKTLTKIWTPTSGTVLWNGQDLHKNNRRKISQTLSLVPQNPPLHFNFTVNEIVAMGRHPHEEAAPNPNLLSWALTTVDVLHLKDRPILTLSQGERQRVLIARALVTESPVLLLDEPGSSLDIRHQLEIWNLMQELAKKGKIVIVTNHDIALTRRFCDEVVVLHKGKCITSGKTSEALTSQILNRVFGIEESSGLFQLC